MKTLLASVAVLGLTASAAFATESGPLLLTEGQMDGVTAGVDQDGLINVGNVQVAVPVQAGVCVIVERCEPRAADQRVGRVGDIGRPPRG
jgi:hypothetical protein